MHPLPTLNFISIQEIIAIMLTMAKRTDFVDKSAPVGGPDIKVAIQSTKGPCSACFGQQMRTSGTIYRSRPIYEVSSFSHGKHYLNDLLDADNMLG